MMQIRFYNSLSRSLELFQPQNPPEVNIYTCGVTVYDQCHIGHARSLYIFDVLRRYLQHRGFRVNFVRNITDIDDKIIRRAQELKRDWKDITHMYIQSYYQDLDLLGIAKADYEPKATDHIPQMVNYIEGLVKKGFAYVTETGVYFSVRKFSNYGKLSGQGIEQMLAGARVEPDESKIDPLDFALWKKAKEGEPFWASPWGPGRPGWHIECVVMSQLYFKTDTLDIHAGGRDLIFPHHENEIAQAEALTGKQFARYWLHHGLLTINGQKMSKSLGNFVTIKDFIAEHKQADFLKLFFLTAHYSHPIDYTDERIDEAKRAYQRFCIFLDRVKDMPGTKGRVVDLEEINKKRDDFFACLDDDFNTPKALAVMFNLITEANKRIEQGYFVLQAAAQLKEFARIFGLSSLLEDGYLGEFNRERIEEKIAQRKIARLNKDYALADKIRRELEEEGIILEDAKDGTTIWRRKL